MEVTYKNVTHVIFDMDGLLINTEDLYEKAYQSVFDEFGVIYTFEHKAKIMGMKPLKVAQILLDDMNLTDRITPEEFVRRCSIQYPKLFPTASLLPGVEKLINHLEKHEIRFGISTGSSNENYELKSTNLKLFFSKFDFVLRCGSDPEIKMGKPAPDAYLVAKERFPISNRPKQASDCLVFEDSPNGVESAKAAGMQCVMVPDQRLDRKYTKEATLVLNSIEQFRPELFGLPKYS